MAVQNYAQYRNLPRVLALQGGDVLLKKVFPETRKSKVEWIITTGQKLFEGPATVKVGGILSREKFEVAYNGSHTSEHAAVAISPDDLAEAVGEGVITASVRGRRHERYVVYRCTDPRLRDAALNIAKGLSDAYHNTVTGQPGVRNTSGGQYSAVGAFTSLVRPTTFQGTSTNDFLTHIVDYVYGLRNDRPNLFCSQFAVSCYEAGSLAAFGRTAFGSDPKSMSPMELENILNGRLDIFNLIGKYDAEDDALFAGVEQGLRTYRARWHFNQSKQSKSAVEILENLLEVGDNDYLIAAVAALLGAQPAQPVALVCRIPPEGRLKNDSQLYADLTSALRPTGLLVLNS
jgi:hypothetical protein